MAGSGSLERHGHTCSAPVIHCIAVKGEGIVVFASRHGGSTVASGTMGYCQSGPKRDETSFGQTPLEVGCGLMQELYIPQDQRGNHGSKVRNTSTMSLLLGHPAKQSCVEKIAVSSVGFCSQRDEAPSEGNEFYQQPSGSPANTISAKCTAGHHPAPSYEEVLQP